MTTTAKQLLEQVMALDEDDRVELIDRASQSLEASADPEYIAAWEAEIKLRIDQYESGEVKGIPWREVLKNLDRDMVNGE